MAQSTPSTSGIRGNTRKRKEMGPNIANREKPAQRRRKNLGPKLTDVARAANSTSTRNLRPNRSVASALQINSAQREGAARNDTENAENPDCIICGDAYERSRPGDVCFSV